MILKFPSLNRRDAGLDIKVSASKSPGLILKFPPLNRRDAGLDVCKKLDFETLSAGCSPNMHEHRIQKIFINDKIQKTMIAKQNISFKPSAFLTVIIFHHLKTAIIILLLSCLQKDDKSIFARDGAGCWYYMHDSFLQGARAHHPKVGSCDEMGYTHGVQRG